MVEVESLDSRLLSFSFELVGVSGADGSAREVCVTCTVAGGKVHQS